jgi:phage virion morphogenesis protein
MFKLKTNLQKVIQHIEGIRIKLSELDSLYEHISEALEEEANAAITNQKSNTTGRSFKPLTPYTQERYNKGPKDALKSKSSQDRIVVVRSKARGIEIATNLAYDYIHQYGNPDNKLFGKHDAPIPARQFLPIKKDGTFTESFRRKINQIVEEWLEEQFED